MGWESSSILTLLIIPGSGKGTGLFVYSGAPVAGNPPVMFGVAPGTTTDPVGNALTTNTITQKVFGAGTVGAGQLIIDKNGTLFVESGTAVAALPQILPDGQSSLLMLGGVVTGGNAQTWFRNLAKGDSGQNVPQFVLGRAGFSPTPATAALLEVQDLTAISAASATGKLLQLTNSISAPSSSNVQIVANAAGDKNLSCKVTGDTGNDRLIIDSNGKHFWAGGGAGLSDTFLYRAAANVLESDGAVGLTNSAAPAAIPGVPLLYGSNGGSNRLREVAPSGFDGILPGTKTDTATFTVTQAVATALTAAYNINGSDAVVGAVYRLSTEGIATWGATQQALTLSVLLGGTTIFSETVAATAFAASAGLYWDAEATIRVQTSGAGGTVSGKLRVTLSPSAGSRVTGDDVTFVRRQAGITFNTTIANTLNLQAAWAATVGAPTITSDGSTLERMGA